LEINFTFDTQNLEKSSNSSNQEQARFSSNGEVASKSLESGSHTFGEWWSYRPG
jgi:hypothetical protein